MTVNIRISNYLAKLFLCKSHDLFNFVFVSLEVFNGESIQCADFDIGLPQNTQDLHNLSCAPVMSKPWNLKTMFSCVSTVSI